MLLNNTNSNIVLQLISYDSITNKTINRYENHPSLNSQTGNNFSFKLN